MVIQEYLFLDSSSDNLSNEFSVSPEAETMTLQIGATASECSVMVYGKADKFGLWCKLAAVNLSDLTTDSEISSPGIYQVGVSGIRFLRIHNLLEAGSVKVFGRICD